MPGQQEVRWSQLKVGVLVIVALCALIALVFLMSNSTGGFWSSRLTLRSYFENSAGLKVGAPVLLDGVTIAGDGLRRKGLGEDRGPIRIVTGRHPMCDRHRADAVDDDAVLTPLPRGGAGERADRFL